MATKLVSSVQAQVHQMITAGEALIVEKVEAVRAEAQQEMQASLNAELERLQALKAVNPNIRDEELAAIEAQIKELNGYIAQAQYQLDSLRMIVVSHN